MAVPREISVIRVDFICSENRINSVSDYDSVR